MERLYNFVPLSAEIICDHKKTVGYQTYKYHRHNGYEIYLFLGGNILFYREDKCYNLSVGDMMIIPTGTSHRIESLDESYYERIVLNVKQSAFERISSEKTDLVTCFTSASDITSPIHLNMDNCQKFISLSNSLSDAMKSDEFGSDILADSYLIQLLLFINTCSLGNRISKPNIMPRMVKDVMKYINDNLTGDLRLSKLSEVFYLNESYISHLLKKHTGFTAREYILDQRIETAKRLLVNGCNVSEACYKSGFVDYSNFIRSFTKIVGISPGKYGKTYRNTNKDTNKAK